MAKRQGLSRLDIGTVVIDPVRGIWGTVCANRETVRFGGAVQRHVQLRVSSTLWPKLGATTEGKRRVWYRLRRLCACGPYAVVMPEVWLAGWRRRGPEARLRNGLPTRDQVDVLARAFASRPEDVARVFAVRPEEAKLISADRTLDEMERVEGAAPGDDRVDGAPSRLAAAPETWAGETA